MATARTIYQDRRGADGPASAGHTFVWVCLRDPSPEELASVQLEFGLPDPLGDDSDTSGKPLVLEVSGELVFAEIKTIQWMAAEEAVQLGKVQLVLGNGFVLTVDPDERAAERVRRDLGADAELADAGPTAVLMCVLKHAVEGYEAVLSVLNDAVDEAVEAVFSDAQSRAAVRLYQLARQVLEFRRAAAPLAEMLDRLATELPATTGDRFRRHFRQQSSHLEHLVDGADTLGTLLANALQAHLAEVSVRQNNDMRRISAWAAIWAVPTLLAGIYGMNFGYMLELGWRFSYPLVLVVMVVLCLALYRAFRRYGWL
ncbi:MAG TPA: CorA family divalent cation transporter [Propionibacteriaceae bacterium]|nr:CorA family divalent cation transporter [Propionibacteriaceae bacterium]